MIRCYTFIFILLTVLFCQKINLNSATIDEMYLLNLTDKQIENIIDYRNRSGNITNIYDLLKIPGITIVDIQSIRNKVTVEILQTSTFEKDMAPNMIEVHEVCDCKRRREINYIDSI